MIERKKYGITPLCELRKGKFISATADFHTRPRLSVRSEFYHRYPGFIPWVANSTFGNHRLQNLPKTGVLNPGSGLHQFTMGLHFKPIWRWEGLSAGES